MSEPITLLDVLVKKLPESSRTTLREMIAAKRVLVDGKTAITLKQPIAANAVVEILDRKTARTRVAGSVPFHVVFDDADLIVIDKPAGYLTSSGIHDSRATVFDILCEHFAKIDDKIDFGLVHRLDKDASGLLVFSKNAQAFDGLKAQFASKSAGRGYVAIVSGKPEPKAGAIEVPLIETSDGKVHPATDHPRAESAVTHYQTVETRSKHSLLNVKLETGRKHQIRVHLAQAGCPIAGDPMYHPTPAKAPRLMLAAVELSLVHPRTSAPMTWKIDVPQAMAAWWEDLKPHVPGRPRKSKRA
jgi:23S rRNA pseudouridine1911/1915/1917 synthase